MRPSIFLLCTRNEYDIILSSGFYACICQGGQHSMSMHNNTACKFNCRRNLMISAIRCGEKIYRYIGISIDYQQMSIKISAYRIYNIVHPWYKYECETLQIVKLEKNRNLPKIRAALDNDWQHISVQCVGLNQHPIFWRTVIKLMLSYYDNVTNYIILGCTGKQC